ncbi:MAG TPA: hypothetical protein VMW58_14530 [Anaerolineae bacterium]|nr:hypothetical protein [Anaerolineae bacterium]
MPKKTRIASISLATPTGDKQYSYDNFGVLLGDVEEYPGSASAIIEIDHPTRKDEKGYPVRGRLVAAKFQFPVEEGKKKAEETAVDVSESFLNLTFWHAVERSPKAKG